MYSRICERALFRATTKSSANKLLGYSEKHHIIPKSFKLGGEKDSRNYAYLSAREHFICHKLLVFGFRETPYYRDCLYAIGKFIQSSRHQKRVINSHQYNFIRKCIRESKIGNNNPMYGRIGPKSPRYGVSHSDETKRIIKEKRQHQQITEAQLLALKNFGTVFKVGHKMTVEQDKKRREAMSGRVWVTNLTKDYLIKENQYDQYLLNGFVKGRKRKSR